jgi:hypothetical protein
MYEDLPFHALEVNGPARTAERSFKRSPAVRAMGERSLGESFSIRMVVRLLSGATRVFSSKSELWT